MTTKQVTRVYIKLSKQDMIDAINYWLKSEHGIAPGYVKLMSNEADGKQYFSAEVSVNEKY